MFMSTRTRLRALHPPSRVGLPDQHAILGLSEREKKIEVGLIRSLLWALKPPKGPYEGRKEERERERKRQEPESRHGYSMVLRERERESRTDGRTDRQTEAGTGTGTEEERGGRGRQCVRERERETTRKGRRERDRETGRDCRCLLRSKFKAKPNAPNLQPELCSAGPLKFKADENITNTTVLIPASSRSSQPEC